MKKTLALIFVLILIFALCACKAAVVVDAAEAKGWTKTEWLAADDATRVAALKAIIESDRTDIDAQKSAEASLEGFNTFFTELEDETLTLGEVYELCTVEDVEEAAAENGGSN